MYLAAPTLNLIEFKMVAPGLKKPTRTVSRINFNSKTVDTVTNATPLERKVMTLSKFLEWIAFGCNYKVC